MTQHRRRLHITTAVIFSCIGVLVTVLIFWRLSSLVSSRFIHPQESKTVQIFPTSTATSIPQVAGSMLPATILSLTNWKLTLPIVNAEGDAPREILQPELSGYSSSWFFSNTHGDGVVFRAPVTGITTSGSHYPRSELREMSENGFIQASWSSTEGQHVMVIDEAITAVPVKKRQVVAGQIHDDTSDILVIRLDFPRLYINVGGSNVYLLDANYVLGRRFTVRFSVSDGETAVYYNNSKQPVYVLKKDYSHSYFKAGAYTQSNCVTEIESKLCSDSNFGEVVVYRLEVSHQ